MADKKICVVGDVLVDHYRFLKPTRLSPEAPVVVFKPESEERRPGGAGNVTHNLEVLGAQVRLYSVVGEDWPKVCPDNWKAPHLCLDGGRTTTIKERLVTRTQQIARIDTHCGTEASQKAREELAERATEGIEWADVVVFSDYEHGVMAQEVVERLVAAASDKPTIVDSKSKDTCWKYRGCTIALPNNIEARDMTSLHDFDDSTVGKYIFRHMKLQAVGLTLGSKGIMLFQSTGNPVVYPAIGNTDEEVVDVTGAGDTVTAMVAAGIALGMPYHHAIALANLAASIVVQKRGVATASIEELLEASKNHATELRGLLSR